MVGTATCNPLGSMSVKTFLAVDSPARTDARAPPGARLTEQFEMSTLIDMKRVTIAEAKQTLPALVHEAERLGEIELTRRGKPVAYIVSAARHAESPRRGFVASLEAWLAVYAGDLGNEPLVLPARRRARKVERPK